MGKQGRTKTAKQGGQSTIAQSKSKVKKETAVFKVAGVRKAKTKTVSSSLKKLNVQTKSKTEEANKKFDRLKETLASTKVTVPTKKVQTGTKGPPPDVSKAAEEFAKL
ncbi:ribosomal biogenesis factor-like [Argopecten irradians]|uniref:ribosomal biogenesis factor-like n=1 Tax=Argopecten irradians TaxID=31199 RepID=UPI003714400A